MCACRLSACVVWYARFPVRARVWRIVVTRWRRSTRARQQTDDVDVALMSDSVAMRAHVCIYSGDPDASAGLFAKSMSGSFSG